MWIFALVIYYQTYLLFNQNYTLLSRITVRFLNTTVIDFFICNADCGIHFIPFTFSSIAELIFHIALIWKSDGKYIIILDFLIQFLIKTWKIETFVPYFILHSSDREVIYLTRYLLLPIIMFCNFSIVGECTQLTTCYSYN